METTKLQNFVIDLLSEGSQERVLRWYGRCPKWLQEGDPIPLLTNLAMIAEIVETSWGWLKEGFKGE